jgi:hypothetical protein
MGGAFKHSMVEILSVTPFLLMEQCHEIVAEMKSSSSSLGLNLWVLTFFLFKNWPSQSYSLYSNTSIDLKTSLPDLENFAMTLLLLPRLADRAKSLSIWRRDGCDKSMVAQPLHKLSTFFILFFARTATSLWSIFCGLAVRAIIVQLLAYCSHHSMICQWIISQVIAKSTESAELVFTSMDALLYGP